MKAPVRVSRDFFSLPLFLLLPLLFSPHAAAYAFSSSQARAACCTAGSQQAHLLFPSSLPPSPTERQQKSLFPLSFGQGGRKRRSSESEGENGETEATQRGSEEDTWMMKISPGEKEKHPFFFITPRLPLSLSLPRETTRRLHELQPLRSLSGENHGKKTKKTWSSSLYSSSSLFSLRETLRGTSFLPRHSRRNERRACLLSSSFPSRSSSSGLFSSFLAHDKRRIPSLSPVSSSSSLQAASSTGACLPDIDRATAISCPEGGCRIVGVGSAVPASELTNDDLAQIVSTSDEVNVVSLSIPAFETLWRAIHVISVEILTRGEKGGGDAASPLSSPFSRSCRTSSLYRMQKSLWFSWQTRRDKRVFSAHEENVETRLAGLGGFVLCGFLPRFHLTSSSLFSEFLKATSNCHPGLELRCRPLPFC